MARYGNACAKVEALSPLALDLARQAGGIEKIEEADLKKIGYLRIMGKASKRAVLMARKRYEELQERAKEVLETCRGYLFVKNEEVFEGVVKGVDVTNEDELRIAEGRARKFIEAGIPPIFLKQFAGVTRYRDGSTARFPTVDFIVQFGAGNYFNRTRSAIRDAKSNGFGHPSGHQVQVGPALLGEVFEFRKRVFLGNKIDVAFQREVMFYVSLKFYFNEEEHRDQALARDRIVFSFLEEMLADLATEGVETYVNNKGVSDRIGTIGWYHGRTQRERTQEIAGFLASVPGTPRTPEKKTLEHLSAVFPEQLVGFDNELANRQCAERETFVASIWEAIRVSSATRDFRGIPEVAFVEDPWRDTLLPLAADFLREECQKLGKENPEALFGSADDLGLYIKVPGNLCLVPHFKEVIDEVRFRVARDLSDHMFVKIFGRGTGGRRAALGHLKPGGHAPAGMRLSEYLSERSRDIGAG